MKECVKKYRGLLVFVIGIAVIGSMATNQPLIAGVTLDFEGVDIRDLGEKIIEPVAVDAGLGVGVVPDYEGSEDSTAVPLLFARATYNTGRYVEFLVNRLDVNILASDTWKFGPTVRYRPERNDVDNDAVDRMRKVDKSIEAGVFLGVNVDNWNATIRAAQDIADGHDGFVVRLSAGYTEPIDPSLRLGIKVFTTYADGDYMNAYFSVDANNAARSGLAIYDADGGFKDVGGTLTARYSPWEQWGIMGVVGYKRLIDDAEDSPVVDDEGDANQYFGGLMATYRF